MSELPLVLRLDNVDSLPDGGPVRFEVNRRGLDIGRDSYLDWTLPDPERFISGKHCEIHYRDGAYWLHDVSTNGTSLNGRGGRLTEPHRLRDGDRIHIGHYIVAVEMHGEEVQTAQAAPPAAGSSGGGADVWGDVGETAAAVDRRDFATHARPRTGHSAPRGPADLAEEEISWGVGEITQAPPATDDDIWGAPPQSPDAGVSTNDWEWAPPSSAAPPAGGHSDAIGPDRRAELARERSVQPAEPARPLVSPEPKHPPEPPRSAEPAGAQTTPASVEPARPTADPTATEAPEIAGEQAQPAPVSARPAPQADPFSDLADSAAAPAEPREAATWAAASDEGQAPESARPAPHHDPFSDLAGNTAPDAPPAEPELDAPALARSPETRPVAPPAPRPSPEMQGHAAPSASASGLASRWADGADEAMPPRALAAPASRPTEAGQGGGFIAAFERGAGMPAGAVTGRQDEAFAEELGHLFRLVTQNLQAMLAARAETKSAMRSSERTMIGALENNPLKFSPTPEDALRIMFGAESRSYLDARKTVESSFGDLQKHQIQTFAAMQQALQALIEDLDPKSIEKSTSKDGGLAGIVGSRRAKFWDTYVERFRAKSGRHERGMIDAFMLLFAEMYDRQR